MLPIRELSVHRFLIMTRRITRGMTSFALENRYERTSGALKFFYNWGKHHINDGYGTGEEPLDYRFNSKDRMMGISWYQSASLFSGNRLTAGIDYMQFGGEAWNRFIADKHKEGISDKSENEIAGYLDFRPGNRQLPDNGCRAPYRSPHRHRNGMDTTSRFVSTIATKRKPESNGQ